ncbi:MAG: ABC transporter ATP-binding protein [Planctomycetes bacterium]|nr:ABC transporter ATP-binding protein [Planctomycetota bacterium]
MIQYENISRNYGRKEAVKRLDLTVRPGELLAFLGPNGAGKTTTIKMTVGLLRPGTGTVRVCGIDVSSHPREAAGRLGYVPDQPYLYEKLTGREFLQFIVDMRGMDRSLAQERISQQIEAFSLDEFIDDLTERYSHGMKQRVVFASALLHSPDVLIVDEPMVGLDPKSMRMVKDLLRDQAAQGTTVLMSTHTLDVVEEIADRIGILDRGELLFLGTLKELKQRLPAEDASLERLYLDMTG